MTDDLQARLTGADPLAGATDPVIVPPASRLDAITADIVAGVGSAPPRRYGRLGRPLVLGLAGAALIAGAAVATGVFGPATFQPAGAGVAAERFIVKGSGCAANATVTVMLDGRPFGTVTATAEGLFIVESTIPPGTALGQHAMTSTCIDPAGQPLVQTTPVEVVQPEGSLPPKSLK